MSELAQRNPTSTDLAAWVTSEERQDALARLVPEGVSAERFTELTRTALLKNPELLKADRASLWLALRASAAAGLVPDGQQAAIVVYENKKTGKQEATLIPMIRGVRDTLASYGWMLQSSVVYSNDQFDFDEGAQRVTHRRARLGEARGEIIGAYAQLTHKDGRRMVEVMSLDEIHAVRDKAPRARNSQWHDPQGYPRMVEKTPAHRAAKKAPLDPKDRERIERVFADELDTAEATALMYGSETVNPTTGEITQASPEPPRATEPTGVPDPDPHPPEGTPSGDEGDLGGGEREEVSTVSTTIPAQELTEADELAALDAALFRCPGGKYGPEREGGALTIGEIHQLPDGEGSAYLADRLFRLQPGEFRLNVERFCRYTMPEEYARAMAAREAK